VSTRTCGTILIACVLAISTPVDGQQSITLEQLLPPSAPAFVLLGIEPSSVQRPETPKALTATVLSLVGDREALPKNIALEVTPFWLTPRPRFSFDDFYMNGRGVSETLRLTMLRSAAVSLATSPRLAGKDTVGTSLAVGARVLLWPGRPSALLRDLRSRASTVLGRCSVLGTPEQIDDCQKAFTDSIRKNLDPVGFVLQVSFGGGAGFPGDTVERGRFQRAGVWLSPSYRVSGEIEVIGVARWLRENPAPTDDANTNLWDGGARLRWKPSPLLALSAEAIGRLGRGGPAAARSTSRFGGLVEFRAADGFYLFYAFGKDFAAAAVDRSRLVSSIGLNLGFGTKPVISLR